jgi:hypothetical protein
LRATLKAARPNPRYTPGKLRMFFLIPFWMTRRKREISSRWKEKCSSSEFVNPKQWGSSQRKWWLEEQTYIHGILRKQSNTCAKFGSTGVTTKELDIP